MDQTFLKNITIKFKFIKNDRKFHLYGNEFSFDVTRSIFFFHRIQLISGIKSFYLPWSVITTNILIIFLFYRNFYRGMTNPGAPKQKKKNVKRNLIIFVKCSRFVVCS